VSAHRSSPDRVGGDGLGRWGRVVPADGPPGWLVVGPDGVAVEPIAEFLRDFAARGCSAGSVRSYAYALLRWWRWLRRVDVAWDRATVAEVRDLVLWLSQADKPHRAPRARSVSTVGRTNTVTGKPYLSDCYAPRTVRHSNAVIRAFYEFWIEQGEGPLVNPVVLARSRESGRANAHHNPLRPFRGDGALRHNPKVPRQRPRALLDQHWDALFTELRSDRDRAITSLAVSSAARAGELLGLRPIDLDWGGQRIRVVRKGSRAQQWLPASSESFVWLRLYVAGLGTPAADGPLWWTLRPYRRPGSPGIDHRIPGPAGAGLRPLTYPAMRAVLLRANRSLGTNHCWHDLRHTAALRMSRDEALSIRDVQTVLGHAHITTTAGIYLVEDDDRVIARVAQHLASRTHAPEPVPAQGYDAAALSILFGGDHR